MISTGAIILVKTWSVSMKHKINEHLCTFHAVMYMCTYSTCVCAYVVHMWYVAWATSKEKQCTHS